MAKQKKKRNKSYQGADASQLRPTITRIHAVHRHPLLQWYHDRRKLVRPIVITSGITLALGVIVYEFWRIFNGS